MSIGETLAQARHRAGLSVSQVSEQTRIRPLIIRGIEADDYSVSGGDFYARGNIRDIADAVGADPEPLIEEYDRTYRAARPVSATSLDELLDRSRPKWHRRPGFMLVFGVAAVLIALAFVGYRMMLGPQSGPSGLSVAANTNASPGHDGNGSAGRPDTAGSARATTGSTPSAAASPQASAPSGTPSPTPSRDRPRSMAMSGAFAIGPGGGDNPQDARLAIDGLPGTAWHSSWYTTPRFGNLYGGTGLMVDMGRPVTVTAVRVTLGAVAGANFQIRVGHQPTLAGTAKVARSAGPGGVVQLTLDHPTRGRYVVVWFTKLPPDPAGTYQAAVYGIGVKGTP